MKYLDQEFIRHKGRYLFQASLAALSMFVVLMILDARSNSAVIAALGASSFIIFVVPEAKVSRPRFMIGGYVVGIASGYVCHGLSHLSFPPALAFAGNFSMEIFGALAVGLAIFLMTVTDTEHPPAASLALGLVLNDFNHGTLIVVMSGVVSLCVLRWMFKPIMKNLI